MTTTARHIAFSAIFSLVLLLPIAMVGGCASGPTFPSDAVRIGPSQNNSRVSLKSGQMLVIQLERNPSTGYIWQFITPVNQSVVLPDNSMTYQTDKQKAVDDSVAEQFLRFVAQEPGETNIRLNYVQPEFGPSATAPTYTVHVVVE